MLALAPNAFSQEAEVHGLLRVEAGYTRQGEARVAFTGRGFLVEVAGDFYAVTNTHLSHGFDEGAQRADFKIFAASGDGAELAIEHSFSFPSIDLEVAKLATAAVRKSQMRPLVSKQGGELRVAENLQSRFKEAVQAGDDGAFFFIGLVTGIPAIHGAAVSSPIAALTAADKALLREFQDAGVLQSRYLAAGFDVGSFELNAAVPIENGMSGSPVLLMNGDAVILLGVVTARSRVFQQSWIVDAAFLNYCLDEARDIEKNDAENLKKLTATSRLINMEDTWWNEKAGLLYREGLFPKLGYAFKEAAFAERIATGGGIRSDGGGGIRSDGGQGGNDDRDIYAALGLAEGVAFKEIGAGAFRRALAFEIILADDQRRLVPANIAALRQFAAFEHDEPGDIRRAVKAITPIYAGDNPLPFIRRHLNSYIKSPASGPWTTALHYEQVTPLTSRATGEAVLRIAETTAAAGGKVLTIELQWADYEVRVQMDEHWRLNGSAPEAFRFNTSSGEIMVDLAGLLMHDLARTPLMSNAPLKPLRFRAKTSDGEYEFYNELVVPLSRKPIGTPDAR